MPVCPGELGTGPPFTPQPGTAGLTPKRGAISYTQNLGPGKRVLPGLRWLDGR